jgi:hypothetical protein
LQQQQEPVDSMSTGEVPGGGVEAERALIDERERKAHEKHRYQLMAKEAYRQADLKRQSEELYSRGLGWQTCVGTDPSVLVEAKEREAERRTAQVDHRAEYKRNDEAEFLREAKAQREGKATAEKGGIAYIISELMRICRDKDVYPTTDAYDVDWFPLTVWMHKIQLHGDKTKHDIGNTWQHFTKKHREDMATFVHKEKLQNKLTSAVNVWGLQRTLTILGEKHVHADFHYLLAAVMRRNQAQLKNEFGFDGETDVAREKALPDDREANDTRLAAGLRIITAGLQKVCANDVRQSTDDLGLVRYSLYDSMKRVCIDADNVQHIYEGLKVTKKHKKEMKELAIPMRFEYTFKSSEPQYKSSRIKTPAVTAYGLQRMLAIIDEKHLRMDFHELAKCANACFIRMDARELAASSAPPQQMRGVDAVDATASLPQKRAADDSWTRPVDLGSGTVRQAPVDWAARAKEVAAKRAAAAIANDNV